VPVTDAVMSAQSKREALMGLNTQQAHDLGEGPGLRTLCKGLKDLKQVGVVWEEGGVDDPGRWS
jgi:hypothetical protein